MSFIWQNIMRPMAFAVDAEHAHELGIAAIRKGFARPFYRDRVVSDSLSTSFCGLDFDNPLGVAAGFDKNGVVVEQLASLGFGSVEVGTVTYRQQSGNPKPRMFRLPADQALINRLGFNNQGAVAVAERLRTVERNCIVGVNIGKNKDVPNEEATENYLKSFDLVHPVADYIAVNISSPNTPGLRDLQMADALVELLGALTSRNDELVCKPLFVKIAPDLTEVDIEQIVDICLQLKIDGVIATNTTICREGLSSAYRDEIGGLSGKPVRDRSTEVISKVFRHSKGNLPIIGVGGIFNGQDAFDKIAAGASLVQAYTGFVYGGPTFANDVLRELAGILNEKGFASVNDAVGSSV